MRPRLCRAGVRATLNHPPRSRWQGRAVGSAIGHSQIATATRRRAAPLSQDPDALATCSFAGNEPDKFYQQTGDAKAAAHARGNATAVLFDLWASRDVELAAAAHATARVVRVDAAAACATFETSTSHTVHAENATDGAKAFKGWENATGEATNSTDGCVQDGKTWRTAFAGLQQGINRAAEIVTANDLLSDGGAEVCVFSSSRACPVVGVTIFSGQPVSKRNRAVRPSRSGSRPARTRPSPSASTPRRWPRAPTAARRRPRPSSCARAVRRRRACVRFSARRSNGRRHKKRPTVRLEGVMFQIVWARLRRGCPHSGSCNWQPE